MNSPRLFIDSATLLPRGLPRLLYSAIRPLVERACGFKAMNDLYARLQCPGMTAPSFCEEALRSLDARVEWPDDTTLAPLREWQGPLVLMANHPFGGVEALALMQLMERLRPGKWRLFANSLLASVPELAPHLIALDPLGQSRAVNHRGLAEARRWLDTGGLLGVFPAGRVAGWHAEHAQVLDLPWSDQFARLAASAHAAVALLHVPGTNSSLFLRVPLRWPRLRALFLPHEMMRQSKPIVRFHIGPLMEPALVSQLTRPGHAGAKLRARCHLLAEIQPVSTATPMSKPPDIAPTGAPSAMQAEVEHLTAGEGHLFTQGRFTALLWQRHEAPQLFHELSRLREITFRAFTDEPCAAHGHGHEHVHVEPQFFECFEGRRKNQQPTRQCGECKAARVQQRRAEFEPLQQHPGTQQGTGADDECIAWERGVVMPVLAGAAGFWFGRVVGFGAHNQWDEKSVLLLNSPMGAASD